MIRRTYLGLDIRGDELRAVALRRQAKGSQILGSRIVSLPENTLIPSLREPNIQGMEAFVQGVREVLSPIAGKEDRIAVALPDNVGRIVLTSVDTAFKTKEEGREVLRWQFKGTLPFDQKELWLDYQILQKNETGGQDVLVALIHEKVLTQYEDVLNGAGFSPAVIDFFSLHLYNYYRRRLDLGKDFVIVAIEGQSLVLQFFQDQTLSFHRNKSILPEPQSIFQEIIRCQVGCQKHHPGFRKAKIFLHCDWPEQEGLLDALQAAFERDILSLDQQVQALISEPSGLTNSSTTNLAAATGAAERMMLL